MKTKEMVMQAVMMGSGSSVTTDQSDGVVRWKDLYLRVMKPSKGPGRAGIAPNRRGPSFFCLRR